MGQATTEPKGRARMFAACEIDYCLATIPPMFVLALHKTDSTVGRKRAEKRKPRKRGNAPA